MSDLPRWVYPHHTGKYMAQYKRGSRSRYLGLFDTPEEAYLSVLEAKVNDQGGIYA